MTLHILLFLVILIISTSTSTSAQSNCSRVCRGEGRENWVPYPFGFSNGCEIRLDCSADGEFRVGEYNVQNITRDHILVNFPAKFRWLALWFDLSGFIQKFITQFLGFIRLKCLGNHQITFNLKVITRLSGDPSSYSQIPYTKCDRRYEEIRVFNNPNFALTSRTGLLLKNCSSTLNDCVVSTSGVERNYNLQQCDSTIINNSTMNCYSEGNPDIQEFMNLTSLEAARCQVLYSSVSYNGSTSQNTPSSLEFQSLELGWWVRGDCGCDKNAACRNVTFQNQRFGYRCNCSEGYTGDGFTDGDGCRKRDAGTGRSKSQWAIIALALCVGVGGVTIVIIIILCLKGKFKWKKKPKPNANANVENFLKNQEFLAPKRYTYSQVKKMTNSFETKLGQGGFGSVYKGVLSNQNIVAVKVLSEVKGNGEDFMNEVASVGRTSHVNIVCLVGFCLEGRRKALIYEFMPNGSLERFIYGRGSSSSSQLGWEKLHQIAIGIARGLEYLHKGCNTRILHLDIKPHNILLDQNLCPKISDFGLSKLFPDRTSVISMSHMRGTPGYIAPELFSRNFGQVSRKSDVYSYGMMVLEMVGGRKNIEVEVDHTSEIYFPHWIYKKLDLDEEQLGLHGIVSDEDNEMARKMIIVGLWCIQTNPSNRPTITKVLEMLEGDFLLLEIPPKPYLSSPSRSVDSPPTD